MLLPKQKKNQSAAKGKRFLISVTVLRSAGPIRFVVGENEVVGGVINTALKSYAREARLPVLGAYIDDFILYCPIAGSEALLPWETIGTSGVRNLVLCKKPPRTEVAKAVRRPRKSAGAGIWKAWFTNISSH